MQPFAILANADLGAEEFAEHGRSEQLSPRAVGEYVAVAHEQNAVDLRKNVGQMMGDEDDAGAVIGKAAQNFAKVALSCDVEGVRWLVEEQLAGAVHERAGYEYPTFFPGGHFADKAMGKMGGVDAGKSFVSSFAHAIGDLQMRPERGSGEEAGKRSVQTGSACGEASGCVGGSGVALIAGKVVGDDAEVAA